MSSFLSLPTLSRFPVVAVLDLTFNKINVLTKTGSVIAVLQGFLHAFLCAFEEIFKYLKHKKIDLNTILNVDKQEFSIAIKDGETLEAKIEGTTILKITDDKKLSTSFDFKYTEYEDDGKTIDEEFNLNASLLLNINNPSIFSDINLELIKNAKVTINGMEVWADAFLDELD